MGPYARPFLPDDTSAELAELAEGTGAAGSGAITNAAAQYFNNRKLSIFGGSNEIQKNIISKMILGL